MSCPRNSFLGFPSRSTGSPLTKSIGTRSITRGCLSSTVSVFSSFLQRSRIAPASRQPRTVFPFAFGFARVIVLPLCRNASLDRRSVSGRTSDYTVRNTWWRQSCTAHPREKRPGRIRRPACFFLCLEFLRSEEHTSELQSQFHLVCRLLLEKKKTQKSNALVCRKKKRGQSRQQIRKRQ